jgi:hypothetical protein
MEVSKRIYEKLLQIYVDCLQYYARKNEDMSKRSKKRFQSLAKGSKAVIIFALRKAWVGKPQGELGRAN